MLGLLLLCCCSFSLLSVSSSLVHGHLRLDESTAEENQPQTSYLSELERTRDLLPLDSEQNQFLMDDRSYDEDAVAALQARSMRSPRRCIPHQQSCLGYPLPCCDTCDTCYCRFFNAICYCRRVGHTCPSRRT